MKTFQKQRERNLHIIIQRHDGHNLQTCELEVDKLVTKVSTIESCKVYETKSL
jgi:hypothetical protein